ncbi:Sensor protein ZraS [Acaryochloris thomasi RCC1774]|uniref:histidine kinase n=1 Tax=Acaryochloris thomasi RCC1774 TaxID=1764569 RepID=A0A2W1J981_9CYAN|nr:HAMP domain-containing sensor histidine kinase [Acaryochloris thomasi]PZD70863.1 Sensor protein ZraS [Acaryochloris thomasi RCC1774]
MSQINHLNTHLKLVRKSRPPMQKSRKSSKVERFLQLQIDQLVSQPQIKWARVVCEDPSSIHHQLVAHASQIPFQMSRATLATIRTEDWLTEVSSHLGLNPVAGLTTGFYYCSLNDQKPQYLLLFIDGSPSHLLRQWIKRTSEVLEESLESYQQAAKQSRKIELLEEVVQRVGHQLRHPLSLINLYANNLAVVLPQGPEQEQVTVINQTAQSLNQMLTEIMQCAKNDKLQLISQDLRSLMQETLADFRGWIQEKGIRVRLPERTVNLPLDPLQIKQAFNNLISNAIHFSPENSELLINWEMAQGNVRLSISDEGPGLPQDDLDNLFKPFFTRREGGTGLGLAIVQKVVRAHGGKLWAKNVAGRGAEFSMSLPRLSANLSEDIAC